MTSVQVLRIFLSSPGDVGEERQSARDAIAELQLEPQFDATKLEAVSWDDPRGRTPLVAQLDPQTAVERGLPRPSQCEVVVGIFWARMGSPLPPDRYKKAHGGPYLSGTEYELEDALCANGGPDVLLYRRSEEPLWGARDPKWQERAEQLRLLDAYLDSLKATPRYVDPYSTPAELKERLKTDLRNLLWRRLQAAVVERVRAGQSGRHGLPAVWNVPYLRNPHFTGREELLDELHRKLAHGRVALTATAGVGKTQVALEYAYRHAHEFDLIWWLRAEQPTTLQGDYAALAEPLALKEAQGRELAVVAYAVRRELSRRDRWLLVFDNATEPKEVLHHFPEGQGHILITSRHPTWPFVASVNMSLLTRAASAALLLSRTGQEDRSAADALAEELGDLPLALEQAAAYVRQSGATLGEYLELFRARRAVA